MLLKGQNRLDFATQNSCMSLLCRKSLTPSQQVEEESARFLGISQKSPYLCIRFKIHTLVRSSFFHIVFVLGFGY